MGGARHKGRVAIEGVLANEHAGWARPTILRATDVAVRAIDSENAIVMFKWEITRHEESGGRPLRGNTLLVAAKQDGRWIITAGQAAAVPLPKRASVGVRSCATVSIVRSNRRDASRRSGLCCELEGA